mgnify:CR=1 FL=1
MGNNKEARIAYQNKDVTMKSFADRLKGKTLGVVGLDKVKILDVLPTNLPSIEANELRMDNLFRLRGGAFAIVDYESEYSEENKAKYLGYVARLSGRLYNEYSEFKPMKVIVIYTADVKPETTNPVLKAGDLRLKLTETFLIGLDSGEIRDELTEKIRNGEPFTAEDMMRLAIYPLTYKGDDAKKAAVGEALDIAEGIEDEVMLRDVMRCISVFSDKIITEKDAERIRRRLDMTKIERIFEEEKEKEREAAEKEKEAKAKEKEARSKSSSKKSGIGRTILGTMIAAAATSFARSAGTQIAKNIGGTKKSTSTSKKSTASKSSSSKSSSSESSSGSILGDAVKKATKTAANTATRKVTTEILKSILK